LGIGFLFHEVELGLVVAFVEMPRNISTLIFNFPWRCREWTALLAEWAEVCQHYFSIFGTADDANDENEQGGGPRIFLALVRASALLVPDEDYRPTKHANRHENSAKEKSFALIRARARRSLGAGG
jgi:hypothetical protein